MEISLGDGITLIVFTFGIAGAWFNLTNSMKSLRQDNETWRSKNRIWLEKQLTTLAEKIETGTSERCIEHSEKIEKIGAAIGNHEKRIKRIERETGISNGRSV